MFYKMLFFLTVLPIYFLFRNSLRPYAIRNVPNIRINDKSAVFGSFLNIFLSMLESSILLLSFARINSVSFFSKCEEVIIRGVFSDVNVLLLHKSMSVALQYSIFDCNGCSIKICDRKGFTPWWDFIICALHEQGLILQLELCAS